MEQWNYKWKYEIGDIVSTTYGKGKIQDTQISTIDNVDIPSYWIVFSEKVYPDGCARNIYETMIYRKI